MKKVITGFLYFVPVLAFAQGGTALSGISTLLNTLKGFVNPITSLVFGLAIIYFFWGVAKYILSAGDAKLAAEGRSIMIWGVVALAVMASVFGLINFLQSSFSISGGTITLPTLP